MEDERVDRLLAALPREVASAGFTRRVLARLDANETAAPRSRPGFLGLPRLTLPAAVLAATVVVAASWFLAGGFFAHPGAATAVAALAHRQPLPREAGEEPRRGAEITEVPPAARPAARANARGAAWSSRRALAMMREIRAEHLRLDGELRALRGAGAAGATVYLGGDEDMELVVHLDQVRDLPTRRGAVPPPGE